jgi:hypothetical protein
MKPNIARVLVCSLDFAMLNPTYESSAEIVAQIASQAHLEQNGEFDLGFCLTFNINRWSY